MCQYKVNQKILMHQLARVQLKKPLHKLINANKLGKQSNNSNKFQIVLHNSSERKFEAMN